MPPVIHARWVTTTVNPVTSSQLASSGRPFRLTRCGMITMSATAATVVARRLSVAGFAMTASASIATTTPRKGHETIQRERAFWRSSIVGSSGGANHDNRPGPALELELETMRQLIQRDDE